MNNNTYEEDSSWAYAQCPDVDECGLGLHDCHKEAKCTNTQGSYSCQCKRGFIGDGKHSCTRTYVSYADIILVPQRSITKYFPFIFIDGYCIK